MKKLLVCLLFVFAASAWGQGAAPVPPPTLTDSGTFNDTEGFGLAAGKEGFGDLKAKGLIEGSGITIAKSGDSALTLTSTGSATAYDDIGDPDANGSIDFTDTNTDAGFTGTYTSASVGWGGLIIDNTAVDPTSGASLLNLLYDADGDEHGFFLRCYDNSGGDSKFYIGQHGNLYTTGTILAVGGVAAIGAGISATGGVSTNNGTTTAGFVDFLEDANNGGNYVRLIGPASTGDVTLTLPSDDGDAGEQLQTDGSGNMSWEAAGGSAGLDSAEVMTLIRDTTYIDSALVATVARDSLTTELKGFIGDSLDLALRLADTATYTADIEARVGDTATVLRAEMDDSAKVAAGDTATILRAEMGADTTLIGHPVDTITANLSDGDVLQWVDGSSEWQPVAQSGGSFVWSDSSGEGRYWVDSSTYATMADSAQNIDTTSATATALMEKIADVSGAMVTGNTETRIAVSYDDADNTFDFVVDDMTFTAADSTAGDVDTTGTEIAAALASRKDTLLLGHPVDTITANLSDGDVLQWVDGSSEWQPVAQGGGSSVEILEANVSKDDPLVILNFMAGFDVALANDTSYITLDYSEDKADLTTDVTGTLPVGNGGTGAATLTDGGVLLGSGAGAVTVLGQASNGALVIGETGGDPSLATITAGEGIDVTNGAASITIDGEDATVDNKGVASFATADFVVTSGAVTVKAQSIAPADVDSTSANFVFDDAFHVTSAVADSAYVTAKSVGDSLDLALRLADTATYTADIQARIGDSLDLALRLADTATYTADIQARVGDSVDLALRLADTATYTADHQARMGDSLDLALRLAGGTAGAGVFDFGGATSFELPNSANEEADACGEVFYDTDDGGFVVYDSVFDADAFMPIRISKEATIFAPDGVNDSIPLCYIDSLMYPHGVTIVKAAIELPADAAYSMIFLVYSSADPPVYGSAIDTVTTGASDAYKSVITGFDDATVAVGERIYLGIPATDVDWVKAMVVFYANEGD